MSWSVSLEGLPHHLALSRDGRHLYVALFDQAIDNVVDLEARAIVARPATGLGSHGVFLSPGGERFYVGSMLLDHIAVVDATTFQTVKTIPMDEGVRPLDITQDERRLYAQLSKTHGFVVVDLTTDETIERVELPALPAGVEVPRRFPHTVDHGLKLSADGTLLFCAATIAGYVAVYGVPDHELITTIAVGSEPGWIVIGDGGARCYVTNRADDSLSIISVEELKEIARVPVGRYPQRMAIGLKKNAH
jgi:YVTN family beta-propeller protein